MNRFICIHGHFYQPPRENPWLEEIEIQDSAYPYHDWNARITAECYAPNTASRILNFENRIIDITNNFSKISFNFGPTLLIWLEHNRPDIIKAIVEADKKGQEKFSGHGPAIAQAYNHMIMPLANSRDKKTQVIWGVKDFEYRFGRKPEGMWLPETAVDLESLDLMAEQGIKFSILAQRQANKIRKIGENDWQEVNDKIDPKVSYVCQLPSGRSIALFFYDGPISHDIGFGDLLASGENFANRLMSAFTEESNNGRIELVSIATDGETFGHHHSHGDMALAYCLYSLEANDQAQTTIFAEFLEKHPPEYEVQIFENSSWSCVHGVERWRSNCGCNTGGRPGWNQNWRAPLRGALDWLRDNLDHVYQDLMSGFVNDPWKARDEYIDVVLDRSVEKVEKFLESHAKKPLSDDEKVKVLQLLEMERHEMLMYTSCAWFFDEISGIETVQVLLYAARAIQLAKDASGISLEDPFANLLERAPSNIPEFKNGRKVYEMFVKSTMLDLIRVGVHYGVSSLFRDYDETADLYTYIVQKKKYELIKIGVLKLALGVIEIKSKITWRKKEIGFAVVHFGDHNIVGGARDYGGPEAYSEMENAIKEAFQRSDISEVIRSLDKYFSDHSYSLWHLFRDEQRRVLYQIFDATLKEIENSFRQIHGHLSPIIQAIEGINMPMPRYLGMVDEFLFEVDITRQLQSEEIDFEAFQRLVEEAKRTSIQINRTSLGYVAGQKIKSLFQEWEKSPEDIDLMRTIVLLHRTLEPLSLDLTLWEGQNILFYTGKKYIEQMQGRLANGDQKAKEWLDLFNNLEVYQNIKVS